MTLDIAIQNLVTPKYLDTTIQDVVALKILDATIQILLSGTLDLCTVGVCTF